MSFEKPQITPKPAIEIINNKIDNTIARVAQLVDIAENPQSEESFFPTELSPGEPLHPVIDYPRPPAPPKGPDAVYPPPPPDILK